MSESFRPVMLLSVEQWKAVERIVATACDHQHAGLVKSQVIEPAMKEIEESAGQEMNSGYVSYLVIHLVATAASQGQKVSDVRRDEDGRKTKHQN